MKLSSFLERAAALMAEGIHPSELELVIHPEDDSPILRREAASIGVVIGHSRYMPRFTGALVKLVKGQPITLLNKSK